MLGVVLLAGGLLLAGRPVPARVHVLPDGSQVVLQRVTYGTTHRFPTGNWWERLGAAFLPKRYASHFPELTYSDTNDGPMLVLWMEHLTPAKQETIEPGGGHYGDPPDWSGLFDAEGTEREAGRAQVSGSTARGYVAGYVFSALPSASRELHFRFVCTNAVSGWQDRAVFTFRNPGFQPGAAKAPVYPLSATQDKLKLVLRNFHPAPRRSDAANEMELAFDLFENDRAATNWELHSVAVLDAHGAVYHPYMASWGQQANRVGVTFVGGLSTNSPWQLRFTLKHAAFLPQELYTVRNLTLVRESQPTNLAQIPCPGTTLVLRHEADSSGLSALLVPADENYYLNFVDVISANGRPFSRKQTYYIGQTDTKYGLGFPPGITNVDLTFGVTRKVFVVVTARPTP